MARLAQLDDAKEIHQAHLDVLSNALLAGDFAPFLEGIRLPYTMYCEDSKTVIETEGIAEAKFIAMHRTLKSQGVTQYLRISTGAEFISEDAICGGYETHILHNAQRLIPPYPSRTRLERFAEGWIATATANALQCDGHKMLMPKVSAKAMPPEMDQYAHQKPNPLGSDSNHAKN